MLVEFTFFPYILAHVSWISAHLGFKFMKSCHDWIRSKLNWLLSIRSRSRCHVISGVAREALECLVSDSAKDAWRSGNWVFADLLSKVLVVVGSFLRNYMYHNLITLHHTNASHSVFLDKSWWVVEIPQGKMKAEHVSGKNQKHVASRINDWKRVTTRPVLDPRVCFADRTWTWQYWQAEE